MKRPLRPTWKGIVLTIFVLGMHSAVLLTVFSAVYFWQHKELYKDDFADFSRSVIGDEATAHLDDWYLKAEDRFDRTKFAIFGGNTNPFKKPDPTQFVASSPPREETPQQVLEKVVLASAEDLVEPIAPPPPAAPIPLYLPPIRRANPDTGEGIWTTAGLPRTSPDDILMAKTYIRPDKDRPYASVGIALFDHRRTWLHIVGGTDSPGGDLGVKGPGVIYDGDLKNLLAAWNGGFQGPHGGFGMIADGK